jgi:hypothetical protein
MGSVALEKYWNTKPTVTKYSQRTPRIFSRSPEGFHEPQFRSKCPPSRRSAFSLMRRLSVTCQRKRLHIRLDGFSVSLCRCEDKHHHGSYQGQKYGHQSAFLAYFILTRVLKKQILSPKDCHWPVSPYPSWTSSWQLTSKNNCTLGSGMTPVY